MVKVCEGEVRLAGSEFDGVRMVEVMCCEFGSFVDEVSVAIDVTVQSSSPHRRFRGIVSDLP